MQRFENKVVIVTGAGSLGNIGGATSLRIAAEGGTVVAADINFEGAKKVAAEIKARGGRALAVPMDLGDEASIAAMVRTTMETFGAVHGLHNNAADISARAMTVDTDVVNIDLDFWNEMLKVNLTGALLCCRYAIPAIFRSGGGGLVHTSSMAAQSGEPVHVSYGVIKAALAQMSRHIATRWGKEGIRSNCVSPGLTKNDTLPTLGAPFQEFARLMRARSLLSDLSEVADIAATVAFLLSSDAATITAQNINVDGGAYLRGGAGRHGDVDPTEGHNFKDV